VPEEVTNWIEQNFSISETIQSNLVATLFLILGLVLLRVLAGWLVRRRTEDPAIIYRWRKATEYVTLVLGIISLVLIWLPDTRSFATYLGLLSAGLAIALQAPITDFVGWIFIVWRHPLSVGDRVQIGDHAGDVIDIRYFQFTILEIGNWVDADQSTGRLLHIPNKTIFSEPVANYSRGFAYIWNELAVDVTFESDWRQAKIILQDMATAHSAGKGVEARKRLREAADRYLINYENLTPIVYTQIRESGVRLTVRYLTEPRRRRGSATAIWEEVLDAFAKEPAIDFAYPTTRFYNHEQEGKPALRPEAIYDQAGGNAET
jgi:small-conductance mechanosensitive channel